MDNTVELAGFGLILGFLWFVWPPLVLLGAGILLIVWANTRRTSGGRVGAAAGAAWAAATATFRAYREHQPTELRRVS